MTSERKKAQMREYGKRYRAARDEAARVAAWRWGNPAKYAAQIERAVAKQREVRNAPL